LIIDVPQALMICMDVSSGLVISLIAFDIHIFYIRELLFMQTSSGKNFAMPIRAILASVATFLFVLL